MAWFMNDTNSEVVTVAEVNPGDIITMDVKPAHGWKIGHIGACRMTDRRELKGSGITWRAKRDHKVRRLLKNPDGTVMCATNR